MKKRNITFLLGILGQLMLYSCIQTTNTAKESRESYSYDEMYKDSFDILLNKLGTKTQIDTLCVEMYIALNTCGEESENNISKKSCKIVLNRAERLLQIDTLKENKFKYLEAKKTALSLLQEKEKFTKTVYQYLKLYPHNSLEGNLQLGIHFYARNETDSSNYYLNKTIVLADSLLVFGNPEERTEAIVRKVASHMLLEENNIARKFISSQIQIEKSIKVRQTLAYIDDNFDSIEQELYDMISEIGDSYGTIHPKHTLLHP